MQKYIKCCFIRKQHTAVSDDGGQIWLWGGLRFDLIM